MGRQLLIDSLSMKLDRLTESAGQGDYVFRGKFAQADVPTANRRIYTRSLWEREIKRLRNKVIEGKIYGELDHPDDGKTKLQRVSVLITDLGIDEQGQVIGSMKVLDTSMGKELKAIVDGGGAVGVSSRGYGSVRMNEDGYAEVQDDFTLLTFDPVADPAEESAYPLLQKLEPVAAKTEPVQTDESIDRNKLNQAIKVARNVYSEAIKQQHSHRDALSRAVNEAHKLVGAAYDIKDLAVDIGAEVMTVDTGVKSIAKPTSEEKQGEFMDKNEIAELVKKTVTDTMEAFAVEKIKKTVSESMETLLAEKDVALSEAKNCILQEAKKTETVQKQLAEANQQNNLLQDMVKELGYGLYLQQHLGRHPKLKQIKESLGDLCMIESLQDLQNKIKVHISEVTKIMEAEESARKKLAEEKDALNNKIKELSESLKEARLECDEAAQIGLEHAAALYLEQRIQGNPHRVEMRKRFREMKTKTKDSVDNLINEYRGRRMNESSDFSRIRRSLAHRPKDVDHDNLVENHIKETTPITENVLSIMGENFDMTDIKRLAGI